MAIHLLTLGGLHAQLDGRDLSWLASRSHPSALLVYLAVERSATRDQLQSLLWPEVGAGSTTHRLRNTVYELRQVLGKDCIETYGRELRAATFLAADVLELERAVQLEQYATAVDLYCGPFLAGVHLVESSGLESWIDARRLKYTRLFRQASRAQVRDRIQAGDLPGALAIARAWVAPDPLDDEAEHQLIELLIRCGERAEALAQYDTYSRHLKQDDLQPLDETRALIACLERDTRSANSRTEGSVPVESPAFVPETVSSGMAPVSRVGSRRSRWLLPAGGVILAAGLAAPVWQFARPEPKIDPERVAVIPLVNQTGADSLDAFGAMAAMMLADGLRRTSLVHVAPTASVMAASAAQDRDRTAPDLRAIARETGAGLIVQGAYFLSRDSLVIQPQIVDAATNVVAFPIERVMVPAADEFLAIQTLLERVLITLSGRLDERLAGLARGAAQADLPMSLEAYREFATGIELFLEWNLDRSSLPFFSKAVLLDPTSATALLWNAWSEWLQYANLPRVDSLLGRVERKSDDLSPYDLAILDWLRAWIDGDLVGAHRASVRWTDIGGGIAHTEAAYDAFRLNRVDEAKKRIEDALAIPSNRRFTPTWHVAQMIHHVRGDFVQELRTARSMQAQFGRPMRGYHVRSVAALGQVDSLRTLLDGIRSNNPASLHFRQTAAELRFHGHTAAAYEIGRLAVHWYREALTAVKEDRPQEYGQSKRYISLRLAGSLYDLGKWDEARDLYEALAREPMPPGYSYDYYFAYDLEPLGYLGIDAARRGDRVAAEGFIEQLGAIDRPYMLGNDLHWQARITAALGECDRTVELLDAALRAGAAYWQWGGFPLLREVSEFAGLQCPALERFLAFKE
ncbi:MAG: BTAD domain-containing putative transcriptional regulator [Longimicrobiales bacterium]